MSMRKVAVVGAGMTKFVRRAQETPKELSFQATKMALESCELTLDDIEGVCMGTAPDAFDGIHMKGEYLSDGSGAWNKPYMRSFVGGGTGVFAPIQGWYHVASGLFDVVAHPDLIRRFTGLHSPYVPYEAYADAAKLFIDCLVTHNVGFEINVKGLVHPVEDMYPSKEFLARYLAACEASGKPPIIVIGTDAHYPEHLGTNLDQAADRLRELGVFEISTFRKRERVPFPLPESRGLERSTE